MDLNGIKISSYIPGRIRLKASQIKGNHCLGWQNNGIIFGY